MQDEVSAGFDMFRAILRDCKLELREVRGIQGRFAYYVAIGTSEKETNIVLSRNYVCDLPGTTEYQVSARAYAAALAKRLRNASPSDFLCRYGVPLTIEIDWPVEAIAIQAASFVHVSVRRHRPKAAFAKCSVIITDQQNVFDLKRDPLRREQAIIDTVRRAVDEDKLQMYENEEDRPSELQQFPLVISSQPEAPLLTPELERFLSEKAYLLAFRQGDIRTAVWIADPWDAEYLGVKTVELIQAAQVLEANDKIVLDSTQEFATVGKELLKKPTTRIEPETPIPAPFQGIQTQNNERRWDVFICHASEDKESFVRPLAETLREKGAKVWYDEFTLKLGDSLRRSIDRGLKYSRFGVVVLSLAFFEKDWPQRELDGLTQREIGGRKVILPVWHKVTRDDVRAYSLMLADRFATSSSEGIEAVVAKILEAIRDEGS